MVEQGQTTPMIRDLNPSHHSKTRYRQARPHRESIEGILDSCGVEKAGQCKRFKAQQKRISDSIAVVEAERSTSSRQARRQGSSISVGAKVRHLSKLLRKVDQSRFGKIKIK